MAARFPRGKQPEFPAHCIGTRIVIEEELRRYYTQPFVFKLLSDLRAGVVCVCVGVGGCVCGWVCVCVYGCVCMCMGVCVCVCMGGWVVVCVCVSVCMGEQQ